MTSGRRQHPLVEMNQAKFDEHLTSSFCYNECISCSSKTAVLLLVTAHYVQYVQYIFVLGSNFSLALSLATTIVSLCHSGDDNTQVLLGSQLTYCTNFRQILNIPHYLSQMNLSPIIYLLGSISWSLKISTFYQGSEKFENHPWR